MYSVWVRIYILVCHYYLSSGPMLSGSIDSVCFAPLSQAQIHTTCDQSLESKAVSIVGDSACPVGEELRSADLLRNNVDDLVLISVVFYEIFYRGVVVSTT